VLPVRPFESASSLFLHSSVISLSSHLPIIRPLVKCAQFLTLLVIAGHDLSGFYPFNMLGLWYWVAAGLFVGQAFPSPAPQASSASSDGGPIITVTSTLTATVAATGSTASVPSLTTDEPLTYPTSWLSVTSVRSGSPVHFLPLNAAGFRFYLGGRTISYCPDKVRAEGACPEGDKTVLSLCNMVRCPCRPP
jgi:hypothetical protein